MINYTEVQEYTRRNGVTGHEELVKGHTRAVGINGQPVPRGHFSRAARAQRERFWGTIKKARKGDEAAIAKCEDLGIFWQPLA